MLSDKNVPQTLVPRDNQYVELILKQEIHALPHIILVHTMSAPHNVIIQETKGETCYIYACDVREGLQTLVSTPPPCTWNQPQLW